MFETVVIATDDSESAGRAVDVALDLAERFDATVHALYVVDERDVSGSPDELRADVAGALADAAEDALDRVRERAGGEITTAVREGRPPAEICRYADEQDADVVAIGTRGRHGDHAFVLGSVADSVVRRCDCPVLTIRQLSATEDDPVGAA